MGIDMVDINIDAKRSTITIVIPYGLSDSFDYPDLLKGHVASMLKDEVDKYPDYRIQIMLDEDTQDNNTDDKFTTVFYNRIKGYEWYPEDEYFKLLIK